MKTTKAALAASILVVGVLTGCGRAEQSNGQIVQTVETGSHLPAKPAAGHSVSAHGRNLSAVTVDKNGGLVYQHSVDNGANWRATPLSTPDRADTANVALSPDGARVAVMAVLPGTANTGGTPALFVGTADGALTSVTAPSSGYVAWAGTRLLVAGGAQHAHLYLSDDNGATWSALAVDGTVAPRFNLPPDAPSVGQPVNLTTATVLPVVLHDKAAVRLDRSTDGANFTPGTLVPLAGELAQGAVPVVAAAGDTVVVAEPGSATLHVVSGSTVTTLTPTGLPGPVDSLDFADAMNGLAQVSQRSCTGGKQNCSDTVGLFSTADGGHTWQPAG